MYESPKSDIETHKGSPARKVFNTLIFTSLVLTVLFWILPLLESSWLELGEMHVLSYSGFNAVLTMSTVAFWALGIFWCFINLGLLFRIAFVRTLFLFAVIITTLMSLLLGLVVQTPLGFTVGSAITLIDGAMLIFAYFTSVADEFKKMNQKHEA